MASLELKLKQLESEKASLESSSDDHSKYQLEQIKQLEIVREIRSVTETVTCGAVGFGQAEKAEG